jgi:hypothetical protein
VPVGDSSGRSNSAVRDAEPICTERAGCFLQRDLDDAGYAIARAASYSDGEASWYLMLSATYKIHSHKHADELAVIWQNEGIDILADGGKYSYNVDEQREYVTSRRAHSTLSFVSSEGVHLNGIGSEPYGSGIIPSRVQPWGIQLEGRVDLTEFGVEHERIVQLRPRNWLIIFDRTTDTGNSDVVRTRRNFLFAPAVVVDPESGTVRLPDEELQIGFTGEAPSCATHWARGQRDPEMAGWISFSYGQIEPTWSMYRECPFQEDYVATVFALGEPAYAEALKVAREELVALSR